MKPTHIAGHIIAFSAFLAFITIQISPLWAKLDYSNTNTPCPIHAMQARQEALYAKHQNQSHKGYAELMSHLGHEDGHHDPDMICLPGMDSHTEHHAHHDSHESEDEKQHDKPWACPYCSIKETAFLAAGHTGFGAPQLETLAIRYFSYTSEPAKISAIRAYHSRAPPVFS